MPILPLRRSLTRIAASLLLGLAGTAAVHAQADPDEAAWSQARRTNTVDAYQDYLSEYPLGTHSQDAFALIIRLSQPEDIEQAINPAAGEEEEPSTQEADRAREPDPPDPY